MNYTLFDLIINIVTIHIYIFLFIIASYILISLIHDLYRFTEYEYKYQCQNKNIKYTNYNRDY